MKNAQPPPELTAEQQKALDASDGVVNGPSFVLMRTDAVLDWFGFSTDELRRKLQPGLDQIDRSEGEEWNLNKFLAEMHERLAANSQS